MRGDVSPRGRRVLWVGEAGLFRYAARNDCISEMFEWGVFVGTAVQNEE